MHLFFQILLENQQKRKTNSVAEKCGYMILNARGNINLLIVLNRACQMYILKQPIIRHLSKRKHNDIWKLISQLDDKTLCSFKNFKCYNKNLSQMWKYQFSILYILFDVLD
jgi:hypothetical protein